MHLRLLSNGAGTRRDSTSRVEGVSPALQLGTEGFASIGALHGALTMSLRAREVLLPLLLLPVTVPVVLAAVKATTTILANQRADLGTWIGLPCVFGAVFITLAR
jgi:heme exporter protein B